MIFTPPLPPPQETVAGTVVETELTDADFAAEFPAEQDQEFDGGQLRETLVVAPRANATLTTSSAKVSVVTGDALRETGERSLPRALGRAAGVWIQESNLGGGAPIVRGLYGNQILIMVDGVRLNDSTTRFGPNQSLNTLDPAIVDRIEVIHGSSSVLFGSDAIGGVIAIWTKRRQPAGKTGDTAIHGELAGRYDTATEGSRTWLEGSGATERVGIYGAFSTEDWGDLTAGGGEEQPFTGYSNVAAFSSVDLDLDDQLRLRVTGLLHRDFDVPRTFNLVPGFGQSDPSFVRYDFQLQERQQLLVALDDEAGGLVGDRMQLRLFARQYNEDRDRQRFGSSTRVFSSTQVETIGLGVDWTRALGENHFLTFGLDLENDRVDSSRINTDLNTGVQTRADGDFAPNARYTSFGAFVQDELTFLAPTFVTLGLRYSAYDFAFGDGAGGRERGDFSNLNASVEVARDLSEFVRWSASLAQGFQAPNLEDLANDGDFAGGTEIANPDLDPAKSWTVETGLELNDTRWSGHSAIFFTRINDFIGRRLVDAGDPSQAGDETFLRSNAGHVELYGVELAGGVDLFEGRSDWRLEGVANWVRGRQFDDTVDPNTGTAPLDGVDARRIPPLHGRLSLAWHNPESVSRRLVGADLTFLWAAKQDELNPDDITDPRIDPNGTSGWTTWSADFNGKLAPGVEWSVALVNLFDERYRVHGSGIDAAGRSLVVGLRIVF